jgi:hypothetical protein
MEHHKTTWLPQKTVKLIKSCELETVEPHHPGRHGLD